MGSIYPEDVSRSGMGGGGGGGQFCTTPPNILSGGILVGWTFKIPILVGWIPTGTIPNPDHPPLGNFSLQLIFSTERKIDRSFTRYLLKNFKQKQK